MKLERQIEIVKKILGEPLPTVESIYYEGAKLYEKTATNAFVTPYVLKELFTPEEMRMVLCLPATSEEIAKKLNLNVGYVNNRMQKLLRLGRILPSKDYRLDLKGYSVMLQPMTLRDRILQAYNGMNISMDLHPALFKLVDAWGCETEKYDPDYEERVSNIFRVIPKWESIKNLPGVMFCENMYEIIDFYQKKDQFSTQRCVCRQYRPFSESDNTIPGPCASGIAEYDNKSGNCLYFAERAGYYVDLFNAYRPTEEEAKEKLRTLEKAVVVYSASNRRRITFICCCCIDCCAILNYEKNGFNTYIPSRFKPIFNEKKCISCGKCFSRCVFNAITLQDNKPVIDLNKCKGCGNCVVTCPSKALKMKIVKEPEWIPEE